MMLSRNARLGFLVLAVSAASDASARSPVPLLAPGPYAWRDGGTGGVRGITVGPIESTLHPNKGYGSDACAHTMDNVLRMGGSWVSLTPFGRVSNLSPTGIDPTFEVPFPENRRAVERAVEQAHAAGLRVLLVPHLWVESGDWRALIDPPSDEGWKRWTRAYEQFVLSWARVAASTHVDMFSMGVELRSWVTTPRAPAFSDVISEVRRVYPGPITYAANWDDVEDTVILGALDVIGVNAFFPLAHEKGASREALRRGGEEVRSKMQALAEAWQKPVVFTEIGYTTRSDPAFEPWTWPDAMTHVTVDQEAQALAFESLIAPLLDEPWFVGFFVWRVYADPDDMSQEAEWGFSPRGKLADLVVRDAFASGWAADGVRPFGRALTSVRATEIGKY